MTAQCHVMSCRIHPLLVFLRCSASRQLWFLKCLAHLWQFSVPTANSAICWDSVNPQELGTPSGKHACACAYAILPVRIRRPRRRQGGERQRRHYNQPGARKEQTARAREREADKRRTQGARATEQGGTKELRKTKASRRTASQQVSRAREKEENTRHHQVQERGGKRAARRKYASLRVAREPFRRPQQFAAKVLGGSESNLRQWHKAAVEEAFGVVRAPSRRPAKSSKRRAGF